MHKPVTVVYYGRSTEGGGFSIERVFSDIQRALGSPFSVRVFRNPFLSSGIIRRMAATLLAPFYQGDINHIVGDVHFLALLLRKRKTVLTIHDCATLERTHGLRYALIRFFWYWLPMRRVSAVTVISAATKRELRKHLGAIADSAIVIPDCVSPEFNYSPAPDFRAPVRILVVGTKANKNIPRIAAASAGLDVQLTIIGALSAKQAHALRRHRVSFDNRVNVSDEELVQAYRDCDLLLFPSLYEGFGLPIIEAQATGRPVITSNAYSMPEVAGDGAILVDSLSEREIGQAINTIIHDEHQRRKLVRAGVVNAQRFSATAVADQYKTVYQKLLLPVADNSKETKQKR